MKVLVPILCVLAIFQGLNAMAEYTALSGEEVEKRLQMLDYDNSFTVEKFNYQMGVFGYEIFEMKLKSIHPWTQTDLSTDFLYYKSQKRRKRPLMVIIPPILGVTPLDSALAHFFVMEGYNVIILKYNEQITDYNRPLEDFNRALVSVLTSARLLLDFAETKEEIDSRRVATYGMSLGAIVASIYAGVEDRVDAAVLIAGGGHIPEIMAKSQFAIARMFRNTRKRVERIGSDEEFQYILEDIVLFDPLVFAPRNSPDDIYMVISDHDSVVHTKNQRMLWEAYGRPEYFSFRGNHFPTILVNLANHWAIFNFLKKRLNKEI